MLETDEKDLIGKFIVVTLTSHELSDLLFAQAGIEDHPWSIAGTVDGKTNSLGLWLRVVVIQDKDGNELSSSHLGEEELLLLPWSALTRTTLFDKQPKKIRPIGFRS